MLDYNKIIKNEENLYSYVYFYDWDDGFKIPYMILDEKECSLQVALLMFESAGGITYLETKGENLEKSEWSKFISDLYNRILNDDFKKGRCTYDPDLTNDQIYKLKKAFSEEEYVFITPINVDSEKITESNRNKKEPAGNLCDECVRKTHEKPVLGSCPMCGEKTLTAELQGASMLLSCSNCDYNVAGASFFPPCYDNEDFYTITVLADDIIKENKIRISKCFGVSVVELCKELSENAKIETTVKLDKTVKILKELKDINVPFVTTPPISEKYPELPGCRFRGNVVFC